MLLAQVHETPYQPCYTATDYLFNEISAFHKYSLNPTIINVYRVLYYKLRELF